MRIFVSYRRNDSQHTSYRIADRLRAFYGRENVFIDIDNLPAGVDFRDSIKAEIESCDVVLVVIGRAWTDNHGGSTIQDPSDWVRIEVETALHAKVRTIPVLVDDAKMPDARALPAAIEKLAYLNAAAIGEGRDFHPHVDWLINSMNRRTGWRAFLPRRRTTSGVSPATLAILALVLAINGGAFFYFRHKDQNAANTPDQIAANTPPPDSRPTSKPSASPPTPTPEPAPSPQPASSPPAPAPKPVPAPEPTASPALPAPQPAPAPAPTAASTPKPVPASPPTPAAPAPEPAPTASPPAPEPEPTVSPPAPAPDRSPAPTADASPAPDAPDQTARPDPPPAAPPAEDASATRSDACTVGGLDPNGNNWLALRDSPSFRSSWSNTRMGPGTQLTITGRQGEWRHVRLQSGEEGWASSRFIRCGSVSRGSVSRCTVQGLDPNGDNWLALRQRPNLSSRWSTTRMGPGTPLTILGTSGDWRHVRLGSGEEGWASGHFIRCE